MEGAERLVDRVAVANSFRRMNDLQEVSTIFYKLNICTNNIIVKLNSQNVNFMEKHNGQIPDPISQDEITKLCRLYEYVLEVIRKKKSSLSKIKLNRILGTPSPPIFQDALNCLMESFNLTITLFDPEEENISEELHNFIDFLGPSVSNSPDHPLMTPDNTFRPLSPPSSAFAPIEFHYPGVSIPTTFVTTSIESINSPQEQARSPVYLHPIVQAQYEPPPSPFWEGTPPEQAISKEPSTSRGRKLKKAAAAAKSKIQNSKNGSLTESSTLHTQDSPWNGRLRKRKDKCTFNRFGRT